METKKISFGFSKVTKKANLLPTSHTRNKEPPEKELIECLEGQSIKLANEKPVEEEKPLVIAAKENTITTAALLSLRTRQAVLNGITNEEGVAQELEQHQNLQATENETIDQKAVRELLEESRNKNKTDEDNTNLTLPLKPEDLPLDGAAESTLEDYDSIPIAKFGFAMLRGMGWKDETAEKKRKIDDDPVVRPKGMGLGADKMIKAKPLLIAPESNEVLQVKKNAYVRILAGKNKDLYGQIDGLDDHAGRVIVKLALGGNHESLNEFMVQPVSKKEYAQYAKIINSVKYEEYKKMENDRGQIVKKEEDRPFIKTEKDRDESSHRQRLEVQETASESRDRLHKESQSRSKRASASDDSRDRERNRDRSRDRQRRDEERRRHSSEDSDSSRSRSKERRHKKKSKKNKHKSKSHKKSHDSSSEDEKRHKKKTKRSKRPRSRSKGRR